MLTRDEAAARAQMVPAAEYRIDLDFTGRSDTFRSVTTVEFDAPAGATTFIDLVGTLRAATLNGRDLDPASHVDGRLPLTDLEPANVLTVTADCSYRTDGSGIHRLTDPESGETYLYSQFATDDARGAFACFDQPDIKGTFAFTITAPAHWEVLSNTRCPAPEAVDDGRRWAFAPTVPLPCYAAGVVAGPYVYEETELRSARGPIPARVYGRPEVRDHLAADELFADTQAGIDLYERIFQTEYPYDSYDQVYVPQYNWGAMENAGCVTISEDRRLYRGRASDAQLEHRSTVVLHELAHMWFGNLVTMRWWDDLWLNESFAEFVSTHAAVEVTRWDQAWITFGAQRKSIAYVEDQYPTTHPVLSDVPTVDAVAGTFDMITYAKGASALRQLAATVGAETFFSGVAAYIRTHHHGNATLADLIAEIELASGRDLAAWSRAWLETAGVTTLAAEVAVDDTGRVAGLTVKETVPDGAVHHPHRLRVAAYTMDSGTLHRTWFADVDTEGARTDVPEAVGIAAPDLVLVNDEDLTYAKTHLDQRSLATVLEHPEALTAPMVLHLVLDSLWHMCRDGALPAAQYVDAVLAVVPQVTNSQVIETQLENLGTALARYVPPAGADALAEAASDSLRALLDDAPAGSDLQLSLLRAYAAVATPHHAAHLRGLLDGDVTLEGLPIDSELSWDLVTALARCGRIDAAEIDERLVADPGEAGQRRAAGARASIATVEAKRRAWNALAHPDGPLPPTSIAREIAAGITRGASPALIEPLLDDMMNSLRPMTEAMNAFMAKRVAANVLPVSLAGRVAGLDDRLALWLDSNADAPPVLVKIVTEALDEIRRAERAQQRHS